MSEVWILDPIASQTVGTLKMAPMVRQDTLELLDDIIRVNFDEITMLATSDENFLGNDHVSAEPQPSVVVQPASPEVTPTLDVTPIMIHGQDFLFDSSKLSGDNYGLDTSSQPASPLHMPPEFFLNPYTPPASPEFLVLQNAIPESFSQQALSPAAVPQQALSPEPFSSLYLDLPQLSASPESLTASPASSYMLSPSPESLTASPASSYMLSPSSVCQEEKTDPAFQPAVDAPKRRGRKRKYPEGMAPSRRRPKAPKVYEMGPLDDDEKEKKRKNAVNAKKHRDAQKAKKQQLSQELEQAKAERDELLKAVNQFKQREEQLLQVLRAYGIKTNSLHTTLDGL